MYHKRGLWAIKDKNGGVFPRHDAQPKAPAPAAKAPKFYPADDVKKPLVNKRKPKPTKLRFLLWLSLCFFFFFWVFLVVLLVGYMGFLGNCLGAEKMWDFFILCLDVFLSLFWLLGN